jgi:type II secretory pathway pseudopilin PulG
MPTLPPPRGDAARGAPRRGEQGYNLVILMVTVTVMMIFLAAAMPAWSHAVRRSKEEELIFRGLQYAEGIRVFQQRFGRLPNTLQELVEVHPRCMRQLWRDPFTGERDWVPVRGNVPPGAQGDPPPPPPESEDGRPIEGVPDGEVAAGPIRGVRSRHRGEALKIFFDKERYEQWAFTVDLLMPQMAAGPGGDPTAPQPGVRLRARWLGRPFQEGLQPGAMGKPPDSGLPPSDLGGGDKGG